METTHSNTNRRPSSITAGDGAGKVDSPNPVTGIIGRCRRSALGLLLLCAFTTVSAAAELSLTPTEVMLVDGRKVQGQLACELDSHLVLYSPGLGALKSFRKEFVASYTRGGKAVKVSAPRALTAEETKIDLDWNGWPDAVPEKGPKPAYTTQKWSPPKRLLVWKTLDGKAPMHDELVSGQNRVKVALFQGQDPANWLVLGAPLGSGNKWDLDTDVILPSAGLEKFYSVIIPGAQFRHLMVENHAWIGFGDPSGMNVAGNFWVHERGRGGVSSVKPGDFIGPYHTFCRNDRAPIFDQRTFNVDDPTFVAFTWDNRGYRLAQYVNVKKDAGASVEFLGSHISGDKFWIFSGIGIIGPDSSVHADTRNGDWVQKNGTLQLMSGAHWGKCQNKISTDEKIIEGLLEFGTRERPLTKDAVVQSSWKDYTGISFKITGEGKSFTVEKVGKVRMCSADPKTARVVFRYLNRDLGPQWVEEIKGTPYRELPRRTDLVLLGDVELDGVVFEDVHQGGVRLGDPAMKAKIKNVTIGQNCGGTKLEELFALYEKGKPPVGWSADPVVLKLLRK